MKRPLGHSWVQIAMTGGDRANRANKIVRSNILENVAMSAVLNGGHHRRIFGVTGEDKNAKLGRDGQKPPAGLRDGGIRKLDVQQHHVRGEALNERDTIRDSSRLTHNRHIRFEVKQGTQPSTDHLVIINHNDAGLWLFHTGVSMGSNENSAVTCVPPPVLD